MTCRWVSKLVSAEEDGRLSSFGGMVLRFHLLGCRPCSRFRKAVRLLGTVVQEASQNERLPEEARDRICQSLREAR